MLTRPAESFAESALRDPDPCPHRRDRPHIREKVAHIEALCLVEQVERAAEISFGLPYPGHRHTPAVPVLRQPGVLAEFVASEQKLCGGRQIVALAGDLTHAHVHVRGSPQHWPALLTCELQRPLEGAQRLAE